uniref:Uncharacterized protein n=1 Tax=Anguilla anguilla TaxID=7936 RepID=A0A0E9QEY8_ANGAN
MKMPEASFLINCELGLVARFPVLPGDTPSQP